MKRYRKKIIKVINLCFVILLFVFSLSAQDINFSSNYYLKNLINPSLVVLDKCSNIYIQSTSISNSYNGGIKNILATTSAYYPRYKSGFVLFVHSEFLPDDIINRLEGGGSYSFNIKLARNLYFIPSLQINYYQQKYNLNNIIFPSMINPITGNISNTNISSYPYNNLVYIVGNISSAIIYKKFFAGIKVNNIISYEFSSYQKLNTNFLLTLGGNVRNRENNFYLIFFNRFFSQTYLEGIWNYRSFSLGAGLNMLNFRPYKIDITLGYTYNKWNFIFGYGFTFSNVFFSEYLFGTQFNFKCKKSRQHTIICPAYQF